MRRLPIANWSDGRPVTHSSGPTGIEIRMIGVDHGQLTENGLLQMEAAVFTPREVPLDTPKRVINEPTLERRLTQTTRRRCTPAH